MKYYQIAATSDPKIIGVKNGVHQGEIIWNKFQNPDDKYIIENYFSLEKYRLNTETIEPFNFSIEFVNTYKSAKLTDFFSFTPRLWGVDFFVSDKLKTLLSGFNLPLHSFIPVNVFQAENCFQYWALYIPNSYREDAINFENSRFYKDLPGLISKQIVLKNVDEYYNDRFVKAEKLSMNANFNKNLDLFSTLFHSYVYFVSESLKSSLLKHNITGFRFREPARPEILV